MEHPDRTGWLHLLTVGGTAPLLLWWVSIAMDARRSSCRLVPVTISCEGASPGGLAVGVEGLVAFVGALLISWLVVGWTHRRWPLAAGLTVAGGAFLSAVVLASTNADHLPEDRWMALTAGVVAVTAAYVGVVRSRALAHLLPGRPGGRRGPL